MTLRRCFKMGSGTLKVGQRFKLLMTLKVPDPILKQSLSEVFYARERSLTIRSRHAPIKSAQYR